MSLESSFSQKSIAKSDGTGAVTEIEDPSKSMKLYL
jgi:hypothetical protein